jgi:hypothetical protein
MELSNVVDVILGNVPPPSKRSKRSNLSTTTSSASGDNDEDAPLRFDGDIGSITATAAQLRNGRTVDQLLERMSARDAALDPSGGGGSSFGKGRRPTKRKRGELQKAKHNVAEKKRRSEMNDAIDRIKVLLPQREETGVKATKVSVLLETADYIEKVQELCCRLAEENQTLSDENAHIKAQLSALRVADQWTEYSTVDGAGTGVSSLLEHRQQQQQSSGLGIAATALLTVLFFTFWGSFLNVFDVSDSEYGITRVLLSIPSQSTFITHAVHLITEGYRSLWNVICVFRFVFMLYLLSSWCIPVVQGDALDRASEAIRQIQGLRFTANGTTQRTIKLARRVAKLILRPVPKPSVSLYLGIVLQVFRFVCIQLWFGYWIEKFVLRLRGLADAAAKSFPVEAHAFHMLVDLSPRTDATFWYTVLYLYNDATVFPGDSPSEQLVRARIYKGISIRLRHQFNIVSRLFATHCDRVGTNILAEVMVKLGPVKSSPLIDPTFCGEPSSIDTASASSQSPSSPIDSTPTNAANGSVSSSAAAAATAQSSSRKYYEDDDDDDDNDDDYDDGVEQEEQDNDEQDDEDDDDYDDDDDDDDEHDIEEEQRAHMKNKVNKPSKSSSPTATAAPRNAADAEVQQWLQPLSSSPAVPRSQVSQNGTQQQQQQQQRHDPVAALPPPSFMGQITATVSGILSAVDAGDLARVEQLGLNIVGQINEAPAPPLNNGLPAELAERCAAFGRAQFHHIVAFAQYEQGRLDDALKTILKVLDDAPTESEMRISGLLSLAHLFVEQRKLNLAQRIIDDVRLKYSNFAIFASEKPRFMLLCAHYHAIRDEHTLAASALDSLQMLLQQRDLRFTELVLMELGAVVALDIWARLKNHHANDNTLKVAEARYKHFTNITAKAACTSGFFKPAALRIAAREAALTGDQDRASQLFGKCIQCSRDMGWEHSAKLAIAACEKLGVRLSAADVTIAI